MPLRTQGYTIDRLSGPIEAHLLQPKREYKQSLPILFMLGDRHNSMSQLCKNCECKGAGDSNCCLEIFSDTFLKLLDQLAQDRKVSFYTEFFEPRNQKELWLKRPDFFSKQLDKRLSTPPKGVMQMLRERLVACYLDTQIKKKNGKGSDDLQHYCPTTMLDWEYSDLRQINTNASIEELIDVEPYFYEPILFRSLYYVFLQFNSEEDNPILDKHFNVISIAKRLGPIRARDFFHSLSLLLRDPIQFSTWFFSDNNSLKSVSLLSNLVQKSSLFGTEDVKKWMILELQYYTHQGSWYDSITKRWSDYFEQLAQGKMASLPSGNTKPKETIVFVDLCLPFLDLYFLLHSFSKKKGLSIGYFGSTHIQGIVDLLVNKLKLYTHISNHVKGKKGEERCLVLDEVDWDIDSIIEKSISGPSKPINIPKVSDGFVPAGRILRTNKILKSVKSPKQNKKVK
jgi:hypothetical protein